TTLTITNPLVNYRALIATKRIVPDQAQLRLALHLEKLYDRLKNYEPEIEYRVRLKEVTRTISNSPSNVPLSWGFPRSRQDATSLALTRRLTHHESAVQLNSPQGLLLHGEVGTGKSMLIDLLADCLPTAKKRRLHFNTFMLEILSKLETYRLQPSTSISEPPEEKFTLLRLAREMIRTNPILFLDEFQMPDRAASKILSHLLTAFFHLGGVLVATSNRMPEELAKASGLAMPPPRRLLWGKFLPAKPSLEGRNEFADFLEVLKARCEIWDMTTSHDYRRRATTPEYFSPSLKILSKSLNLPTSTPWQTDEICIYSRKVTIPRHFRGITMWTFSQLCEATLGPADYLTLASRYHTFILTHVPVLTTNLKNEARRLITLLDALYECKCRLCLHLEQNIRPDGIFFPADESAEQREGGDAVYAETVAEVYQDLSAPFRPNVLTKNPEFGEEKGETSVDFGKTAAFTGEDERFAYKRAQSRIWELCSREYWERVRHVPLERGRRGWEGRKGPVPLEGSHKGGKGNEDTEEAKPKFDFTHFWGMMKWGRRAGNWGQGVEGVKAR
ncbi:hypothetical protein K470DRAFT_202970, partial [Piedraia hortae CBS 480.64]